MGEREERFARLFAAAYGPLVAYARRRVGPSDADDVVAEVLTIAWRRLDDVPDRGALPWLYRVAYQTIGNMHRSERRRLLLVRRMAAQPVRPALEPEIGDAAVLDALARLRPPDQEILRLAAWEGLEPAEISVVLGCSPNAAAIRLSRARARLREELKGSGGSRTHDPQKEIDV